MGGGKGLVSLRALQWLLKRYPDKGIAIIANFAVSRDVATVGLLSFTQVFNQVVQMVASLFLSSSSDSFSSSSSSSSSSSLHYTPLGNNTSALLSTRLALTRLAQLPSWVLLNEEAAFEEIVSLGMLIFDDNFKSLHSTLHPSTLLPSPLRIFSLF